MRKCENCRYFENGSSVIFLATLVKENGIESENEAWKCRKCKSEHGEEMFLSKMFAAKYFAR